MPYSLSFSESFFSGDGECDLYSIQPSKRPTSVLQAIISLPRQGKIEIAKEILNSSSPEFSADHESFPFDVLEKIRETNTCSNLDTPVSVWIDEDGYYDVLVY